MRAEGWGTEEARVAAAAVRERIGSTAPDVALILGSGLGRIADELEDARAVAFSDIPGFATTAVSGHAGKLVAGRLEGRNVLTLAGRLHAYEGHSLSAVAFPVRLMHALGARVLFASNAAGGIRRGFKPGDLMIIEDHLNLMFHSPLQGSLQEGDERFPDMGGAYDPGLRALLLEVAKQRELTIHTGVYAALLGPSYETRAEIRMLERLGADAVGMSTVPEVIVARAMGMRVAAVSCISNLAAGIRDGPLHHAEVLETTARVAETFASLVRGFVAAVR